MAQLKSTVTKEEFEALAEPLREFYKQDKDKFVLEAPEGFEPKSRVNEFRQNNIDLMKERDELKKKYGDLDPEEAREALKIKQQLEEKKLKDEGEFDKALEARTAEMSKKHTKERADLEARIKAQDERLSVLLIDNALKDAALKPEVGVLPKAISTVVTLARGVWKLDEKGNPVAMKNGELWYGDDGNPITMEKWVANLKADHDYLFGKPQGGGGGGGDGGRPHANLKRSKMTTKQKSDYITEHGQDKYDSLPWE